ncbi:MAG: deoxynucleoside kinase [Oscillospiraceae bacterium]|nr:deoxynucleoside kinase [Oscillospiraceae bacterium]
MGKLIVLEGTDGCGKSTQLGLLAERLKTEAIDFLRLRFPRYEEESSALIRMYLGGAFGSDPSDVNAYAASTFFAVDRYASYMQDWKDYYMQGGLLISDRYTTSNAVHQGSKLNAAEREEFFRWLYDMEFGKMQLPKPDLVILLDLPIELSQKMLRRREADTNTTADIHEKSADYLADCRTAAKEAAKCCGWSVVPCAKDGDIRSVEEIHEDIYALVRKCMEE